MRKVLCIVGPTASGKSAAALEIAERLGGVIINADSVQLYRGVEIGSAQPTSEDRSRCPHLLYGMVDPPARMTAGDFCQSTLAALAEATGEGPLILVGGSGFYLRALQYGMFDVPPIPDDLNEAVDLQRQQQGTGGFWDELRSVDPSYAQKIGANDSYRIVRAIKIIRATGRTMSEVNQDFLGRRRPRLHWEMLGIKMDRSLLTERIARRVDQMITRGIDHEVQQLVSRGFADWAPLEAVGLRESKAMILGHLSPALRRSLTIQRTLQLAKKQMTWFKREDRIEWFADSHTLIEGGLRRLHAERDDSPATLREVFAGGAVC